MLKDQGVEIRIVTNAGKIISGVPSKPGPTVIWRDTWVAPYISSWAILERFKAINYANSKDIFVLFGTEEAKKNVHKRIYRNLTDLNGLVYEKLISVFGTSIFEGTRLLIEKFILPLCQGQFNPQFIRKHLAYCPECLKLGYHSIFHQFSLLDLCPFHQILLLHRCSGCGQTIPYELSRESKKLSFYCSCGYELTQTSHNIDYKDAWNMSRTLIINSSEIAEWLSQDNTQLQRLSKLILFSGSCLVGDNNRSSVLKSALSIISLHTPEKKSVCHEVTSKLALYGNPVVPLTLWLKKRISFCYSIHASAISKIIQRKVIDIMTFEMYVFICLFQSYKSIARYIRKHCLHNYDIYVKNFFNENNNYNYCVESIAFARWRQEFECKPDPWRIEKRQQIRSGLNKHAIPALFSIIGNSFLYHILTSKSFNEVLGDITHISD